MVGLGAGARSYTSSTHWSTEYAVAQQEVRRIVADYTAASRSDLALARVGIDLDGGEQRRRWVIKSILRADGLDHAGYRARFGTDPVVDLPVLDNLLDAGMLHDDGAVLRPTAAGLERSDAIGPALVSPVVGERSAAWVPR